MDETTQEDFISQEENVRFAGFWSRFGAALTDGIILSVITIPITYNNITSWKIAPLFIVTALFEILYKPFMEYRYGATLGKMAAGIRVVGPYFERVTISEELKRVSFYMIPSILQMIFSLRIYFSPDFLKINNYNEYNQLIISSNPATIILGAIIFFLASADCITFLMNAQHRALHDLYAGTYVIEK